MDERFRAIAALAADHHSIVSAAQLRTHGVDASLALKWERRGLITRVGSHSFALAGSTPSFEQTLASGLADLDGHGVIAGRSCARLHRLDGFVADSAEFLVRREHRNLSTNGIVRSTRRS